jgi:hypothetical protein
MEHPAKKSEKASAFKVADISTSFSDFLLASRSLRMMSKKSVLSF